MGDPLGIGPEVVVKALAMSELHQHCWPVVIGDKTILARAIRACDLKLAINPISAPEQGKFDCKAIDLIEQGRLPQLKAGQVQPEGGRAAYQYLKKAVALALARQLNAIATAPINKESLKAAGINYIGHTEMLAHLTNCSDPLTMFECGKLRIFFLSRHVSLKTACSLVTKARVYNYIIRCFKALQSIGIKGVLAVAGLNPHCGENGLFGREEVEHIAPAVQQARENGYDVVGPISADSVFALARSRNYAAVLSMYHDQGHIAAKTLDFERTIALTLGLPFLRTSVDHGTAFDIAATGQADATSMLEAIKAAARYSFT